MPVTIAPTVDSFAAVPGPVAIVPMFVMATAVLINVIVSAVAIIVEIFVSLPGVQI